jgi:biopolymer transport protein ExbD
MAAIDTPQSSKGRPKKLSTRVDLTPMVDLGFLLITFFVFTSTMAKPVAMKIDLPNDTTTETDNICESCVLTTILYGNNQIGYYEGFYKNEAPKRCSYSEIRDLIVAKKRKVQLATQRADRFVLIIQPTTASSFKNFVDITDEVAINDIKRYYVNDVLPQD